MFFFFEEMSSEPIEWRRGYYNQERTWEAGPPKPVDVNEIVRRHTSQKSFAVPASSDILEDPDVRRLRYKILSLDKAAAQKKRKYAAMQGKQKPGVVSSDDDSASDSSSQESD